jgi:hypothetical protein
MSNNDLLASLGIEVGVGSHPTVDTGSNEAPSINESTGVVTTLSVLTSISWIMLGYTAFKLRRIWLLHLRNRFEYALSTRTDLIARLRYEFIVGGELHSSVTLGPPELPEPEALEEVVVTTPTPAAEDELSEVVAHT